MSIKAIGVLTAGGDAPGMNAAVRAVTRSALGSGLKVHGIQRAFEGLMESDICELGARDVGGILQRGGTVLQTARYPAFSEPAVQQKAISILRERGIGGLVAIGGDGTMRASLALHRLGFPVIGIPASIDNDVYGTDIAIGVDTALNTILEAIDKLRDTASSHRNAFIVETMGRHCGYLALMSGITSGAEMTLIPEQEASAEEVAAAVRSAHERGKTHAIIVVSEGASLRATTLKERLDAMRPGFGFRVTILGHVQRGGSPSAWDRLIAARFGVAAVERMAAGERGVMLGLRGREVAGVPLEEAGARQRPLDLEFYRMARMLAK